MERYICSNCGNPITQDADYCSECGAKREDAMTEQQNCKHCGKTAKYKYALIGCSVVSLLVIGTSALVLNVSRTKLHDMQAYYENNNQEVEEIQKQNTTLESEREEIREQNLKLESENTMLHTKSEEQARTIAETKAQLQEEMEKNQQAASSDQTKHPMDSKNFDNGVYIGDLVDGVREGTGTMNYNDGTFYSGNWHEDQRDGEGIMYYSGTDKWNRGYYVGSWENGRRSGTGALYYTDGKYYTGGWEDDHKSGSGSYVFENGDVYKGIWEADDDGYGAKNDGMGLLHRADGSVETGAAEYWRYVKE